MKQRAMVCGFVLAACGGPRHCPDTGQPAPSPATETLVTHADLSPPPDPTKEARLAYADPGGMWTPQQMTLPVHVEAFKQLGVELEAQSLSDPAAPPLNAVVWLGGCTGSFVSSAGLIVTNHHCVQQALQVNTSKQDGRNVIEDGFLARARTDEPSAGAGVRVNVAQAFKDVTAEMRDGLDKIKDPVARKDASDRHLKALLAACEKDRPGIRCQIRSYFNGSQYIQAENLELRDIRLVYAPPRSVGDYGGEVDNWHWPRHTGDWSFYRAYVGKDGPARGLRGRQRAVPAQEPPPGRDRRPGERRLRDGHGLPRLDAAHAARGRHPPPDRVGAAVHHRVPEAALRDRRGPRRRRRRDRHQGDRAQAAGAERARQERGHPRRARPEPAADLEEGRARPADQGRGGAAGQRGAAQGDRPARAARRRGARDRAGRLRSSPDLRELAAVRVGDRDHPLGRRAGQARRRAPRRLPGSRPRARARRAAAAVADLRPRARSRAAPARAGPRRPAARGRAAVAGDAARPAARFHRRGGDRQGARRLVRQPGARGRQAPARAARVGLAGRAARVERSADQGRAARLADSSRPTRSAATPGRASCCWSARRTSRR